MIRQIAPLFFTTDLAATLTYYKEALGFECLSTWHDPPVYAIVARQRIHFRLADPPTPNPDRYVDELLASRADRSSTRLSGAVHGIQALLAPLAGKSGPRRSPCRW